MPMSCSTHLSIYHRAISPHHTNVASSSDKPTSTPCIERCPARLFILTAPDNEYTMNCYPHPKYTDEVACLLQEWLYGGDYDMFIAKETETPGIVWVKARSGVLGRNELVPYCRDEACWFGVSIEAASLTSTQAPFSRPTDYLIAQPISGSGL